MNNTLQPAVNIEPVHLRMARVGIGLTVRELATISGTNKATIVRIEAGNSARSTTLSHIREILEAQGARFYQCNITNCITVGISGGSDYQKSGCFY